MYASMHMIAYCGFGMHTLCIHMYAYMMLYKYVYHIQISAGPSLEGATRLRRGCPVKQLNSYLPES